jgi:hypothetical protein
LVLLRPPYLFLVLLQSSVFGLITTPLFLVLLRDPLKSWKMRKWGSCYARAHTAHTKLAGFAHSQFTLCCSSARQRHAFDRGLARHFKTDPTETVALCFGYVKTPCLRAEGKLSSEQMNRPHISRHLPLSQDSISRSHVKRAI